MVEPACRVRVTVGARVPVDKVIVHMRYIYSNRCSCERSEEGTYSIFLTEMCLLRVLHSKVASTHIERNIFTHQREVSLLVAWYYSKNNNCRLLACER